MRQMQKTILSSSLHIKNVQAEHFSTSGHSDVIIIIIIIITNNYLFIYLFRNFLRIRKLGIRDFILFNLFLF